MGGQNLACFRLVLTDGHAIHCAIITKVLTAGLCLVQVQAVHPLTRYRLQRLISTREEDLVGMHRMGSIAALEKYAEGTSSQLLYLQVLRIFSLTLTSHAASQQTP